VFSVLEIVLSLVLAFFAGGSVWHVVSIRTHRRRICAIVSADDHTREAARLVHRAIRTKDLVYKQHLRDDAFQHYVLADKIENGPYFP